MRYAWQDTALGDLDLPLHTEELQEHLYARLSWKNLRDYCLDTTEGSLKHLHLATHFDMSSDFHNFLINHSRSQGLDDLLTYDGSDAAKFHNMRDPMTGPEMAVRGAVVEAGEEIARKHGLRDTHSTGAARALKTQHGAKNFHTNIAQDTSLRSRFLTRFALHAKPVEVVTFKTRCHCRDGYQKLCGTSILSPGLRRISFSGSLRTCLTLTIVTFPSRRRRTFP